jgi:hypothetical protein
MKEVNAEFRMNDLGVQSSVRLYAMQHTISNILRSKKFKVEADTAMYEILSNHSKYDDYFETPVWQIKGMLEEFSSIFVLC